MLVHRKAGKFTVEEFDEALASYNHNKQAYNKDKPLIFAFVKPTAEQEQPAEVQKFLERYCGELQQYPSIFDGVDTIKLKILLHLERSLGFSMELSFRDSELLIGDKTLDCVHLERVPMYAGSEAISDLREDVEELEAELADLRETLGEESERYRKKEQRLQKKKNELHKLESQLMSAAKTITSYMSSGRGATERARRAAVLLEEGRTEEALAVLDDERRREELRYATENADRALANAANALGEVQKLVDEVLIKIEAIKMRPLTGASAEEMIKLYREAEASIVHYGFDRSPLIAFAVLLREQNMTEEALAEAEALYEHFSARPDAPAARRAEVCDILARLYYLKRGEKFHKAERLYLEAIRLAEQAGERDEVAFVCNNLGYFYKATCRYEEAKKVFGKSCEIRRTLAEENTMYRPKYAWSLNSLADVYAEMGEHAEAIELYERSLEIRREEAARSQNEITYVARTCHNLGNLYLAKGDAELARKFSAEALGLRRSLQLINPDVQSGLAAQSCISLACAEMKLGRTAEARTLLSEGERFLEHSKDAFTPERKADLFRARGELAEAEGAPAEKFYEKALELRRTRAVNGAAAIMVDMASDCLALARARIAAGRHAEAEPLLAEAEAILQQNLSGNPAVYGKILAECKGARKK
ncbi:MAG: tetratricopeptide repeat protein [Clostridia bacterium]|nr:tetratricopeptide repeat protein [Clostridia bacterium]